MTNNKEILKQTNSRCLSSDLSLGDINQLSRMNLLDNDFHPTEKAYLVAVQTLSDDNSSICNGLQTHANNCLRCNLRYETVLNKLDKHN